MLVLGRRLGEVCLSHFVSSEVELAGMLRVPSCPLWLLVDLVHAVRQHAGTRRTKAQVRAALLVDPLPKWLHQLLRQVLGVYLMLRHRAHDRARLPRLDPTGGLYVPRRLGHVLRAWGLPPRTWITTARLRSRAAEQMKKVVETLRGTSAVMWVDNYYRPRLVLNPAVDHPTLNCTAMAVLNTTQLPRCPGLVPFAQWDPAREALVRALGNQWQLLHKEINRFHAFKLKGELRVRVPLDLVRDQDVLSLQWTPFSLNGDAVGIQVGLLRTLRFCQHVASLARCPMPLLMDVDLHWRCLKLAYGERTQGYRVREVLGTTMPPLFGLWHAYKHTVTVVYRSFFPLLTYLAKGSLPVGEKVRCFPKVREMELVYGAILRLDPQTSSRLKQAYLEAAREYAEVQQRLRQPVLRLDERGQADLALPIAQAMHMQKPTEEEVRRARMRMVLLRALYALVRQYVPACLYMGFLVREANWHGRAAGGGKGARQLLLTAVLVLMRLAEGGEHTVGYIRAMLMALLCWNSWFDALPLCCYSEEINEAGLARLDHDLQTNPRAIDVSEANLVYLLVKPGRRGFKRLRDAPVSQELQRRVTSHVQAIAQAKGPLPISYVQWRALKAVPVGSAWPRDPWFPRGLSDPPDQAHLADLVVHCQRVLVRQQVPNPEVATELAALVGPRDPGVQQQEEGDPRAFLARNPEPQRYRQATAPRSMAYASLDVTSSRQRWAVTEVEESGAEGGAQP